MSASLLTAFGAMCLFRAPVVDAAITVAAADSSPVERSRADLVCDGVDDQQELAQSLAFASRGKTAIDVNPNTQRMIESAVNHAVQWLPGNYQLSSTLEIPDAVNCVINAEGTTLHNLSATLDGVIIRGMNRCRYRFGTIESQSTGAALRIEPTSKMPALMSFVDFAGLIGKNLRGTGLLLNPTHENICVNRFVGTDVAGFDKGVVVAGAGSREGSASTQGKCDTNWFWLSYVRMCQTCIEEGAQGVDCSVWEVNVDASVPDSVAIRAGGAYGKWYVIMGTYTHEHKNLALVLEPGAKHCVIEMHPPIDNFSWEDHSEDASNSILDAAKLPTAKLPRSPAGGP